MRLALKLAVAALAVILVTAGAVANARIQAHGKRKYDVMKHVRYGSPHPRIPPAECVDVWISSISRFWAIEYSAGRRHGRCRRWTVDGAVFLHHTRGRWRIVYEGSDFDCSRIYPIVKVRYAIGSDLLGCAA